MKFGRPTVFQTREEKLKRRAMTAKQRRMREKLEILNDKRKYTELQNQLKALEKLDSARVTRASAIAAAAAAVAVETRENNRNGIRLTVKEKDFFDSYQLFHTFVVASNNGETFILLEGAASSVPDALEYFAQHTSTCISVGLDNSSSKFTSVLPTDLLEMRRNNADFNLQSMSLMSNVDLECGQSYVTTLKNDATLGPYVRFGLPDGYGVQGSEEISFIDGPAVFVTSGHTPIHRDSSTFLHIFPGNKEKLLADDFVLICGPAESQGKIVKTCVFFPPGDGSNEVKLMAWIKTRNKSHSLAPMDTKRPPLQQDPLMTDFSDVGIQCQLEQAGITFGKVDICVGDAYLIPKGMFHYFTTVSGIQHCSIGWHSLLDRRRFKST